MLKGPWDDERVLLGSHVRAHATFASPRAQWFSTDLIECSPHSISPNGAKHVYWALPISAIVGVTFRCRTCSNLLSHLPQTFASFRHCLTVYGQWAGHVLVIKRANECIIEKERPQ